MQGPPVPTCECRRLGALVLLVQPSGPAASLPSPGLRPAGSLTSGVASPARGVASRVGSPASPLSHCTLGGIQLGGSSVCSRAGCVPGLLICPLCLVGGGAGSAFNLLAWRGAGGRKGAGMKQGRGG